LITGPQSSGVNISNDIVNNALAFAFLFRSGMCFEYVLNGRRIAGTVFQLNKKHFHFACKFFLCLSSYRTKDPSTA